jgi:glycine/D-amino acid oxidase-like deaminating enzyme
MPLRVLDKDRIADWLIVGAGFAGLSAARRLAQTRRGESIVVLEARQVADGPAGRNSGLMIDLPHNLASGEYSPEDAA